MGLFQLILLRTLEHTCKQLREFVKVVYLDGHVVDVQAERDPLVKCQLWFPGAVDVHSLLGLNVALLVIDASFNYTIPDRLAQQKTHNSVPGRENHLLL